MISEEEKSYDELFLHNLKVYSEEYKEGVRVEVENNSEKYKSYDLEFTNKIIDSFVGYVEHRNKENEA